MMYQGGGPQQVVTQQQPYPREKNGFLIAATVLVTVGGILAYVGLGSPWWASNELIDSSFLSITIHVGLWVVCGQSEVIGDTSTSCSSTVDSDSEDWVKASQVLAGIAFISMPVAGIMMYIWICTSTRGQSLKVASLIGHFISVGCIVGALITFGAEYDDDLFDTLDWAFYLTIVGCGVIALGAGFFIAVPAVPRFPQQPYPPQTTHVYIGGQQMAPQQQMYAMAQPTAQQMYPSVPTYAGTTYSAPSYASPTGKY